MGIFASNCSDFIRKDEWPPNSPDLNLLDFHVWGAMLEYYKTFQPKPNTIDELKNVLQTIWDDLPQNSDQQGHTELCQKTSSLCENWGWTDLKSQIRLTPNCIYPADGSRRCQRMLLLLLLLTPVLLFYFRLGLLLQLSRPPSTTILH